MYRLVLIAVSAVLLSACGDPYAGRSAEWVERKNTCAAGNYDVCADIAHEARAENDRRAGPPAEFRISEPIVD